MKKKWIRGCPIPIHVLKKAFLIMRLTFLLTVMFSLSTWATSVAQESMVTLQMKDASLEQVILELREQTGMRFFYSIDKIKSFNHVSIQAKGEKLADVLNRLLEGTGLTYTLLDDVVVIKDAVLNQKKDSVKNTTVKGVVRDVKKQPIPGVTVLVKGTTIGVTTDADGKFTLLVPSVETSELIFSFVGMKSITLRCKDRPKQGDWVITMEDDVIAMDEVNVVSTGYGYVDRRRLTSAVTSLKMDDIKVDGFSSIDKMLEGHVPGMIFMQNSGQAGAAPKLRIRGTSTVLGDQEPLWVLDGVVLNEPVNVDPANLNDLDFVNLLGNAISGLNPDDIEQIDVLKDAAATAIYGVRAANGVIVITTKKGKLGPPKVTYSLTGTLNIRPYYSDKTIYVMDSRQRVEVSREMFERGMEFTNVTEWVGYEKAYMDYKNGKISYDDFRKQASYYETVNTDWFDLLCSNSFSNKHTLSVSGGSESMRYYASIGYGDEQGVINKEYNRLYTANMKLNGNFKKLDFQAAIQMNHNKRRYTPMIGGKTVVQYAYETSRAIPAFNENDDRWFYNKGPAASVAYPFNILNEMDKTYQKVNTNGITLTGNLKYRIMSSLSVEGTASYTLSNTNEEVTYEEGSWYVADLRTYNDSSNECPFGGELQVNTTRSTSYMLRLQLNYNELFKDKHMVNVSLGGEVSSTEYNGLKEKHRGYYPERGKTFATINYTLSQQYGAYRNWLFLNQPTVSDSKTNLASAYFSASYTYDNRYTLNFNTRMDGSNQFGSRSNEKLLPIWSVSGRWDIREDFFKNVALINSLSLKLSYGYQGNMLDGQTSRMIIVKETLNSYYGEFSSKIDTYPNPDLKWELTSSYNAELEFSLWRNKIAGAISYYYKRTKDAYLTKKVSEINGIQEYVINQGDLTNQGVELTLKLVPIDQKVSASGKRGFVWRLDPQLGQVVNNLISKAIDNRTNTFKDRITYSDYLSGNVEFSDKPLNTFYSYRFKGLSSEDGHPVFYGTEEERKDELYERYRQMEDEEVFEEVMVESGTRVPTIQGGVSNYLGFRQFGLSFNFTYSLGGKMRMLKLCDDNNIRPYPERNIRQEFVNRWQRPGDEMKTNIPSLVVSEFYNTPWWASTPYSTNGDMVEFAGSDIYAMYDMSDLRVVSSDYLKLQTLSFRYNVHDRFCKKMGISSAYLSITGTNLFTIASKKLKGQDVTQSGSSGTINLSVRPNYSLTLNVTF